jgi:hypothetical protein
MSHARGSKALKKHRDAKLLRKRRRNQYKGYPTFEIKRGYSPRQKRKYLSVGRFALSSSLKG